ncbi:MAG: ERF family protein [Magnetococcales bacterium]|nr:ERF family protein [Magnetococcales bacterium]
MKTSKDNPPPQSVPPSLTAMTPANDSDPTIHPMALIQLGLQSQASLQHLEELMDFQQRWLAHQARCAFFEAMSRFQARMKPVRKTKLVVFNATRYTHATLDAIVRQIRPLLADTGLSYRFEQAEAQNRITVSCMITHQEGHSEITSMSAYPDKSGKKNPIQELASTLSYLRRYTLTGALGIAVTDEDDETQMEPPDTPTNNAETANLCSEQRFNKNFPAWARQIKSGEKSSEQIIQFLADRCDLSAEQIRRIKEVS